MEMFNEIEEDIGILRNRDLTGDKLQEEVDRALAISRSREQYMAYIAVILKTADQVITLNPDANIDLASMLFPESYKQADNKPIIASGRKALIDTTKARKD